MAEHLKAVSVSEQIGSNFSVSVICSNLILCLYPKLDNMCFGSRFSNFSQSLGTRVGKSLSTSRLSQNLDR